MFKVLIFAITFSLTALQASFIQGENVVTDAETDFMWQDDHSIKNNRMNWDDAQDFCRVLDLGGYRDWRIPKVRELKKLAKHLKRSGSVFTYENSEYFWSGSVYLPRQSEAWFMLIDPKDAYAIHAKKTTRHCVRCVRRITAND